MAQHAKSRVANGITDNEQEAANRAEAMVLLIRAGYRVYRPEADAYGEDLILRTPTGKLRAVQLKGRMTVNRRKYGQKSLWMLFPSTTFRSDVRREWFLVPHDQLYEMLRKKHGKAPAFSKEWHCRTVPAADRKHLAKFLLRRHRISPPPKGSARINARTTASSYSPGTRRSTSSCSAYRSATPWLRPARAG
jgi:hypothetical protein